MLQIFIYKSNLILKLLYKFPNLKFVVDKEKFDI